MSPSFFRCRVFSLMAILASAQVAAAIPPKSPETGTRFHMPAIIALRQAASIFADSDNAPPISDMELALCQDVAHGRAAQWSLADASLIASGVKDQQTLD